MGKGRGRFALECFAINLIAWPFCRFMPFLLNALGVEPRHNYTAVIYVQIGAALGPNAALYKLVRTITKSQFVDRVSRQSNGRKGA